MTNPFGNALSSPRSLVILLPPPSCTPSRNSLVSGRASITSCHTQPSLCALSLMLELWL
ncbi:hypothetical protein TSMEX_005769 [Taenia solium]|eukprot:TsM_000136200 transcript=TsM_000136200 gene=TsM_000136200